MSPHSTYYLCMILITAAMSSNKHNDDTAQDRAERKDKRRRIGESINQGEHILSIVLEKPTLWPRPEFKRVRECIQAMKSNPQRFSPIIGDNIPDRSASPDTSKTSHDSSSLSELYVAGIASYKEVDVGLSPILQVVSATMAHENNAEGKKTNSIHMTHSRLRDGSNDVMVGRLTMNITHDGNKLNPGDIIELIRFTPLCYSPEGKGIGPRMPAVVIHSFTRIGYSALPKELNDPMHCINVSDAPPPVVPASSSLPDDGLEPLVDVTCTPNSRYCSTYGVNAVIYICKASPLSIIDLEMVWQYCYFATTEVSKMNNHHKTQKKYALLVVHDKSLQYLLKG